MEAERPELKVRFTTAWPPRGGALTLTAGAGCPPFGSRTALTAQSLCQFGLQRAERGPEWENGMPDGNNNYQLTGELESLNSSYWNIFEERFAISPIDGENVRYQDLT